MALCVMSVKSEKEKVALILRKPRRVEPPECSSALLDSKSKYVSCFAWHSNLHACRPGPESQNKQVTGQHIAISHNQHPWTETLVGLRSLSKLINLDRARPGNVGRIIWGAVSTLWDCGAVEFGGPLFFVG